MAAYFPALPLAELHYAAYVLALAALWLAFGVGRKLREHAAAYRRNRTLEAGLTEPVSLHPVINMERCVGCGACTHACPEGDILGMIGGKAQLLEPAACIGHGACKSACPVGAIELVFGSARRGVDIPVVSQDFESNVPGLFIAGELGGMGLIANAIEQGRQAIETIARRSLQSKSGHYDVIIIGAGPAGIAASLAAKKEGLTFLTLEQDTLGGTVARYPRAKLVMTRPATLPLYGKVRLKRVRKEKLLGLWQSVLHTSGIEIHQGYRVERITPADGHFEITTASGNVCGTTVVLATGRRGSPRRLGVPGEAMSKVVYSLDDASQYRGQHVVIVGGGDSALEAAVELSRRSLKSLTLVYRGAKIARGRPAVRERFEAARLAGRLTVLFGANVTAIEQDRIVIAGAAGARVLPNDAVIICAGGLLPSSLLGDSGVKVERKFGTA